MKLRLAMALISLVGAAQAGTVTLGSGELRSVELAKDVDPIAWLERNEVESVERLPLAGGGSIVRFAMDEGGWRARNAAMCTDTGVVSCGTDFCQTYFIPAENEPVPADAQPEQTQDDDEGRLELRLFESEESDDQRTDIEATVMGDDGAPLAGARVLLVPRAPDVESLFASADATPIDPAQVAGERSCRGSSSGSSKLLTALTGDKGGFNFAGAGAEGVDRGCWELITAAACQTRNQPLADLLPEREPQRVLALAALKGKGGAIDPSLAKSLSELPGLRVLETAVLASVGKALVRLEIADSAMDTQSALGSLRAAAGIESAQPEYRYRTVATFNDPYAWMNYGAKLTGADQLLAANSGAGVKIAVIDSGIDAEHPELAARIAESRDFTGYGASADRHGTAVAGLIAAEANNEVGSFGMAPGAQLVALKACEPETRGGVSARCWSSSIAKAIDAALAGDAAIINMSLAGPRDPLVAALIDAAIAKSRLIVAAAGNGGPDAAPPFPASHPGVLAVTAIDTRARLYPLATRGAFVDLAAPGVEVPVPVPGSTYPGQLSGTSMATAYVSGIAATLLGNAPGSDTTALRGVLESSAVTLGGPAGGTQFGRGKIDACAAAHALNQPATSCTAAPPAAEAAP